MGALAVVRDIAIVLLAVESLVIGVLLAVMLLQLRALVRMLREEVQPMLDSAGGTAKRVQGTVELVTDTIVSPLVRVQSWMAGAHQALETFLFFRSKQRPSDGDGPKGL
ncbi:MAG: hypothetical protein GXY68_09780 [Chloroflexi bacterium]|nr:hypothetical protein [Chloroflexota bacterium]